MATFKFYLSAAVLLALLIVGNQAKPRHGLVQDVRSEGLDRTVRQADCSRGFPTCNVSFPSTGPDYMLNFTAMNAYYDQFCTKECIDTLLSYIRDCRNDTEDQISNFYTPYYEQLLCGKNGDNYCYVLYLRNYYNVTSLFTSCRRPNSAALINCTTANSSCLHEVADFSSKMGCCANVFSRGTDAVSSCIARGVNIDPNLCPSAVSSSAGAAVIGIIFTLLLALIISAMYMY